ncbi:MAG: hypothetical protein WCD11_32705 [Solirubrobacteraceae bacterium]
MVPESLRDFFVATAGVAGALIGLLFVAISVAQDRLTLENADLVHQVRASAALTAFTNALTISLFALISNGGIAWASVSVGIVGLLFIAGSLISLLRERRAHRAALRDATFLVGQLVIFTLQLLYGLQLVLVAHGHDTGAAQAIAVLVVACFLLGISRSWELVCGPSFSFFGQAFAFIRQRPDPPDGSDQQLHVDRTRFSSSTPCGPTKRT